ncbi:MAG: hypothetical protein ABIR33_04210, partial [Pyrinomonadaceae bacterium]
DLIDRAVRFYRKNFWTFILMAAPPVAVGTAVSVGWTFLSRTLFPSTGSSDPFDNLALILFGWTGTLFILFCQTVAILAVMGGASRNFVRHILFGEPITFSATYKNLKERFWALLSASLIIATLIIMVGVAILYFGMMVGLVVVFLIVAVLSSIPPLAALVGTVGTIAVVFFTFWLFFLVASRFAYVPQTITVEGLGVFSSIARSASLASGNVRRFAALFMFTILAVYSALAILYIPVGWYAWYEGVDFYSFFMDQDLIPAWYEITSQLLSQASVILLAPVWMVGLCLLYIDERVRHEGYDIELMAARRLGDIPDVPQDYLNPLQPALASSIERSTPAKSSAGGFTTLDLK